jgi:hypothetical protein
MSGLRTTILLICTGRMLYLFYRLIDACLLSDGFSNTRLPRCCPVLNLRSIEKTYKSQFEVDDWAAAEIAIKNLICSDETSGHEGLGAKVYTGDMAESASPADPIFWFIHPTLERLLHYKLLSGGFVHTKWPSDPFAEYVCTRPTCFNQTLQKRGDWEDCCLGHFEGDSLMDPDFNDRTVKMGPTNAETILGTDPTGSDTYVNTYIYDHFDWNHCTEDFSAISFNQLTAMQESYRRRLLSKSELEQPVGDATEAERAVAPENIVAHGRDVKDVEVDGDAHGDLLEDRKEILLWPSDDVLSTTTSALQLARRDWKTRSRLSLGENIGDNWPTAADFDGAGPDRIMPVDVGRARLHRKT